LRQANDDAWSAAEAIRGLIVVIDAQDTISEQYVK
jgi:hypothetical protein